MAWEKEQSKSMIWTTILLLLLICFMCYYVEHNLFKNVSNGPVFFSQTDSIGLNDTILLKEQEIVDTLLITTLLYQFHNDLDA